MIRHHSSRTDLRSVLKERERNMYLAGLYQGKEDALNNGPDRLRKLWNSDTALLRGYVDGLDGWKLALRNELTKAVKQGRAERLSHAPSK